MRPDNKPNAATRSGALSATLAARYDVTLYDVAASASGLDALVLAARVGAALIVARQGRSSMAQMAQFTHSLREFGVTLVGSVLNDA